MAQELITYGSDRRLVLSFGEGIRQPVYFPYTSVVGSADASTDLVTAAAHGLITGDKILITGATPPAGVSAGSYYFVRDVLANTFKVAATSGGAAIDLTTDGTTWAWVKQGWSSMRIGLRGHIVGSTNITGTPRFVFGVCKGNTNGYGAVTSDHVVGVRSDAATMTYNAGPSAYYSFGNAARFKRVGSTVTQTSGAGSFFFSADSLVRNGMFADITKGNTNATISFYGPSTSGAAQSDLTDAEFLQVMELAALSSIASVKANYGVWNSGTLAVDEAADGILDNLTVFWDRSSQLFTFDIKHRWLS